MRRLRSSAAASVIAGRSDASLAKAWSQPGAGVGRFARPAAKEDAKEDRWLGGVWCDLDDEVGVESGGDPLEQGDGRDDAARFQAGEGRLGHAGAGG